jgi:hypothetical protein
VKFRYNRTNSIKSPASGADDVSEIKLVSYVKSSRCHVRVDKNIFTFTAGEVPELLKSHDSGNSVAEVGRP